MVFDDSERIGEAFYVIQTFGGCTNMESITIPSSVVSIDSCVFFNNAKLNSIIYGGTKAQWEAISKASDWNMATGSYVIGCTDGEIGK